MDNIIDCRLSPMKCDAISSQTMSVNAEGYIGGGGIGGGLTTAVVPISPKILLIRKRRLRGLLLYELKKIHGLFVHFSPTTD